jgi:hypothetical protein
MFAAGIENPPAISVTDHDPNFGLIRSVNRRPLDTWTVCTRDIARVGTLDLQSHTQPLSVVTASCHD